MEPGSSDGTQADGIEDHDRGLRFDLNTLNRRRALILFGVGASPEQLA